MPTITYAHALGATVYQVGEDTGVREAIVKSLNVDVKYGNTSLQYNIAFTNAKYGSAIDVEEDLFADPTVALDEFQTRYLT